MAVNTDLDSLAEPFIAKAKRLMETIDREGLPFRIFETRRAFSRSAELFMQGRAVISGVVKIVDASKVVSNARAGSSPHNYGLAVDCVLITKTHPWWDGAIGPKGPWDTGYEHKAVVREAVVQAWVRYARAVRGCDLTYGGDFVAFPDLPHAELKQWKTYRPANWEAVARREVEAGR